MDYTIEVWSIANNHFAQCSCGNFFFTSMDQELLEPFVKAHKAKHAANGDFVEVV